MFDKLEITLKAGSGGNGIVSFRREKFVPYGGPDGGDGGKGGNVVLQADNGITDFRSYASKGIYKATNGKSGSGSRKHGKNGEDRILLVPVGTVVFRKTATGKDPIGDLDHNKQQLTVARGGKGGLGNAHFATSTRQAPEIAQRGELGEELTVILDMRLIAEVGIIGYPNVGKSSLLAGASAAHPAIANYPFTTTEPVLGVVNVGMNSFVLAEIPGLVVGAHQGKGLGYDFLHHAVRTRVFIHLVDGSSLSPVADMITVNNELSLYDIAMLQKPQIVVVNKVDLPEVREKVPEIRDSFKQAGVEVLFVSAATQEGVDKLMEAVWNRLQMLVAEVKPEPETAPKMFRPQPRDKELVIHKESDVFVIDAPGLSRMVSGTGEATAELLGHVRNRLDNLGLDRALRKAGARRGDKVRCGVVEWEW